MEKYHRPQKEENSHNDSTQIAPVIDYCRPNKLPIRQ